MGHKCKLDTGYIVDHIELLFHNKHTVVVRDIGTCVASTSLKIVIHKLRFFLCLRHTAMKYMETTDESRVEKDIQPLSQTLFGLKEAAYSFHCAKPFNCTSRKSDSRGMNLKRHSYK